MIDPQDIANELIAAERERKTIGQFSDNYPDFDLETAYRAQRAFVQSKLDAGERFVGYKLGLTSRNKQQAMGVDAPLYTRRPGELEDLGLIGCVVRVAGEVVMTAAGAAVMGHPAASVAWLANQLAAEERGLAGPGSWCSPAG